MRSRAENWWHITTMREFHSREKSKYYQPTAHNRKKAKLTLRCQVLIHLRYAALEVATFLLYTDGRSNQTLSGLSTLPAAPLRPGCSRCLLARSATCTAKHEG